MQTTVSQPPSPFSCVYTPNLPELLQQFNCSIVFSTYQAGKVVILSAVDDHNLIQLPRNFEKAMGLTVSGNKMAVATRNEVVVLGNSSALAPNYGKQSNTYDALFTPRAKYYTGEIDLHDMAYGQKGLFAVNTRFSCISMINDNYSFEPYWQPPFISDLDPVDRCHLNGMALQNGRPKYVTALGTTDVEKGWRENITEGGILMDVETNEIILEGLPMPHSPRLINRNLYLLLSATGELARVDVENRSYEVVCKLQGFARGMTGFGEYAFVGSSRLRKNSSVFRDLPIADNNLKAGVEVVHLPTGIPVAGFSYQSSVDEIYEVQVTPGFMRPGLLGIDRDDYQQAIVTPTDAYWAKSAEVNT